MGRTYTSFVFANAHSFSRGSVHITSKDPLALPKLDPRMNEQDLDLDILVEALKYGRKLLQTDAMKAAVTAEVIPGPTVTTDEELRQFVREYGGSIYHPVGTASLLPKADGGVVDPNLKVYGTRNLRIVSNCGRGRR